MAASFSRRESAPWNTATLTPRARSDRARNSRVARTGEDHELSRDDETIFWIPSNLALVSMAARALKERLELVARPGRALPSRGAFPGRRRGERARADLLLRVSRVSLIAPRRSFWLLHQPPDQPVTLSLQLALGRPLVEEDVS